MSEELLKKMSELVEQLGAPHIPIKDRLWTSSLVAQYLGCSARQVTDRFAPLPSFPKAIRLPQADGGKSHPKWKPNEIISWAEKHQERRVA